MVFRGQPKAVNTQSTQHVETKIVIPDFDRPISEHEVTEALGKLKSGKTAGVYEVLAEYV